MKAYVVDTNVPVVANGHSGQADIDCMIACIDALVKVREHGIIVLDSGMEILDEYRKNLRLDGQPGPGDAFMKWAWSIQADRRHCEPVALTWDETVDNYAEFPIDPDLAKFDRADRKFVAVALTSENDPVVLNAVDSDWAEHYPALSRAGISILFLCPHHVCARQ